MRIHTTVTHPFLPHLGRFVRSSPPHCQEGDSSQHCWQTPMSLESYQLRAPCSSALSKADVLEQQLVKWWTLLVPSLQFAINCLRLYDYCMCINVNNALYTYIIDIVTNLSVQHRRRLDLDKTTLTRPSTCKVRGGMPGSIGSRLMKD